MSNLQETYEAPQRPAKAMIVCDDGTEYSPTSTTVSALLRMRREHVDAIYSWVDARRAEVEERAAEAERVGREVAAALKPSLDERSEQIKVRAEREAWLAGGGDTA